MGVEGNTTAIPWKTSLQSISLHSLKYSTITCRLCNMDKVFYNGTPINVSKIKDLML